MVIDVTKIFAMDCAFVFCLILFRPYYPRLPRDIPGSPESGNFLENVAVGIISRPNAHCPAITHCPSTQDSLFGSDCIHQLNTQFAMDFNIRASADFIDLNTLCILLQRHCTTGRTYSDVDILTIAV